MYVQSLAAKPSLAIAAPRQVKDEAAIQRTCEKIFQAIGKFYTASLTAAESLAVNQALQGSFVKIQSKIDLLRRNDSSTVGRMRHFLGRDQSVDEVINKLIMTKKLLQDVSDRQLMIHGEMEQRGAIAFVVPALSSKDPLIFLTDLFFKGNKDLQVLAMIHEATHIALKTEDHTYGNASSLNLADSQSALAKTNADNWAHFISGSLATDHHTPHEIPRMMAMVVG